MRSIEARALYFIVNSLDARKSPAQGSGGGSFRARMWKEEHWDGGERPIMYGLLSRKGKALGNLATSCLHKSITRL